MADGCSTRCHGRAGMALAGKIRTLMKVILLGNAGAGKSTLSRTLVAVEPSHQLSLDGERTIVSAGSGHHGPGRGAVPWVSSSAFFTD
jgi:hypothetical protein